MTSDAVDLTMVTILPGELILPNIELLAKKVILEELSEISWSTVFELLDYGDHNLTDFEIEELASEVHDKILEAKLIVKWSR